MILVKRTSVQVNGFDNNEAEIVSYMLLASSSTPKDDEPNTREDVVEADAVYLFHEKYESLGEITDTEIRTLQKFKIL